MEYERTIQILGMGCPKRKALEANAKAAIEKAGITAEVVKVDDADAITEMGAMVTPALAIDGTLKKSGRILTVDEIVAILTA